jgi:hypothetical protein
MTFLVFFFAFLLFGTLIGIIIYLYFKMKSKSTIEQISSHMIMQKMEKVFKIVVAEGVFSEIMEYENKSILLQVFSSTKKALIITDAKVLMGYDFKKCKIEIDEVTRRVKIVELPKVEILSIETEYRYYNMENGLFNKFNKEDISSLQINAKEKIKEKALQSHMPSIAESQLKELMNEVGAMNGLAIIY